MNVKLFILGLVLAASSVHADMHMDHEDMFMMNLVPPDLVMRHRQMLDLSDAQSKEIMSLMQSFQSKMVPIEWELQDANQALHELLQQHPVDSRKLDKTLSRVLENENSIKREHVSMLVKLKNALNAEQLETLHEIKRRMVMKRVEIRRFGGEEHEREVWVDGDEERHERMMAEREEQHRMRMMRERKHTEEKN